MHFILVLATLYIYNNTVDHNRALPNHIWRDNALAGLPVRLPEGIKPLCGYVHPDDAKKWMMFELVSGSGVYIHQENYNVALSKTRNDRPDGKAMARYLMSCFWRQSELVGASIAEPPKPYQKSLDRGIIHAILTFCNDISAERVTVLRQAMWKRIGSISHCQKIKDLRKLWGSGILNKGCT